MPLSNHRNKPCYGGRSTLSPVTPVQTQIYSNKCRIRVYMCMNSHHVVDNRSGMVCGLQISIAVAISLLASRGMTPLKIAYEISNHHDF